MTLGKHHYQVVVVFHKSVMERFKFLVIVKQIGGSILNGRPISDSWGFPDFILNNETMLKSFFDDDVYEVYNTMDTDQKRRAIEWYEISGREINNMAGTTSWEVEDARFDIDLIAFSKNHPDYYAEVVKYVCCRAYEALPAATQSIIVDKFTSEPIHFQNEMNRNR